MSRSNFAGATNYNIQSKEEIISDLKEYVEDVNLDIETIKKSIQKLEETGYWQNNIPIFFKELICSNIQFCETVVSDITYILGDLPEEVADNHINILKNIGNTARQINSRIGEMWHQDYRRKDYTNAEFQIVEHIYVKSIECASNLLDISNIADRLNDYRGGIVKNKLNNPWVSGSFYLISVLLILGFVTFIIEYLGFYTIPVLFSVLLVYIFVTISQLRNDEKLSEVGYVDLMKEAIKSIPIISKIQKIEK